MKQQMKIDWRVALVFIVTGILVVAIAGWGDRVGIPPGAIAWAQAIVSMIGAAVIAMLPKLITYAETEIERRTTTTVVQQTTTEKKPEGGSISLAVLVAILVATAAGVFLGGCGASAIHTSAIAAHAAHTILDASGPSITGGVATSAAACPHDDGAERTTCLDRIEHVFTIAASTHDLLIPEVEAYRAVTLRACGVDPDLPNPTVPDDCPPDDPGVLSMIATAAAPVERDLPILTAAIAALTGAH